MKPRSKFTSFVLALRPNQWTKNAIVFAAFIFALGDREQNIGFSSLVVVVEAAILFCMLSSGVYLFNDVHDRKRDQAHPIKQFRPVAAGEVSVSLAIITGSALILLALLGSALLSRQLLAVMGGYVVLQAAYTYALKGVALLDIFVIAAGFVLRAMAGAVALQVAISPWLLFCASLLALFLILCKRRHEKVVLSDLGDETRPSLEKYDPKLLDQLISIVSASIIVSYALYTLWPDTVRKFGTTKLGFTIPFVIFGIFRYLDLVYRHDKGDRPEKILLTDIPLIIDLVLYGGSVLLILGLGS